MFWTLDSSVYHFSHTFASSSEKRGLLSSVNWSILFNLLAVPHSAVYQTLTLSFRCNLLFIQFSWCWMIQRRYSIFCNFISYALHFGINCLYFAHFWLLGDNNFKNVNLSVYVKTCTKLKLTCKSMNWSIHLSCFGFQQLGLGLLPPTPPVSFIPADKDYSPLPATHELHKVEEQGKV